MVNNEQINWKMVNNEQINRKMVNTIWFQFGDKSIGKR